MRTLKHVIAEAYDENRGAASSPDDQFYAQQRRLQVREACLCQNECGCERGRRWVGGLCPDDQFYAQQRRLQVGEWTVEGRLALE